MASICNSHQSFANSSDAHHEKSKSSSLVDSFSFVSDNGAHANTYRNKRIALLFIYYPPIFDERDHCFYADANTPETLDYLLNQTYYIRTYHRLRINDIKAYK